MTEQPTTEPVETPEPQPTAWADPDHVCDPSCSYPCPW